jgi:hypothetical protein
MTAIQKYNNIRERGTELGESGCCAVIALAVILDLTFEQSWSLLKQVGRRANCGTQTHHIKAALHHVGVTFDQIRVSAKTVKSFRYRGKFIITTCNHALAHQYGETLDHSAGSRRRIEQVFKIDTIPTDILSKIDVQPVVSKPKAKRTTTREFKYALVHAATKTIGQIYKSKPRRNIYRLSLKNVPNTLHKLELVSFDSDAYIKSPETFWKRVQATSVY